MRCRKRIESAGRASYPKHFMQPQDSCLSTTTASWGETGTECTVSYLRSPVMPPHQESVSPLHRRGMLRREASHYLWQYCPVHHSPSTTCPGRRLRHGLLRPFLARIAATSLSRSNDRLTSIMSCLGTRKKSPDLGTTRVCTGAAQLLDRHARVRTVAPMLSLQLET